LLNTPLFGATRPYKRIKCAADQDISIDTLYRDIESMYKEATQAERDAFIRQFKQKLEMFLEKGNSLEAEPSCIPFSRVLLYYAVANGKIEIVRLLVDKGANINKIYNQKPCHAGMNSPRWYPQVPQLTPRQWSPEATLLRVVLVKSGSDARFAGDLEVANYLLDRGAIIDKRLLADVCESQSPQSLPKLKLLLEAGVPIGYYRRSEAFRTFREELISFQFFCRDYNMSEKIRLIEKEMAIRSATDPRETHKALTKIIDDTCGLQEKWLAVLVADYAKSMRDFRLEQELESKKQ